MLWKSQRSSSDDLRDRDRECVARRCGAASPAAGLRANVDAVEGVVLVVLAEVVVAFWVLDGGDADEDDAGVAPKLGNGISSPYSAEPTRECCFEKEAEEAAAAPGRGRGRCCCPRVLDTCRCSRSRSSAAAGSTLPPVSRAAASCGDVPEADKLPLALALALDPGAVVLPAGAPAPPKKFSSEMMDFWCRRARTGRGATSVAVVAAAADVSTMDTGCCCCSPSLSRVASILEGVTTTAGIWSRGGQGAGDARGAQASGAAAMSSARAGRPGTASGGCSSMVVSREMRGEKGARKKKRRQKKGDEELKLQVGGCWAITRKRSVHYRPY